MKLYFKMISNMAIPNLKDIHNYEYYIPDDIKKDISLNLYWIQSLKIIKIETTNGIIYDLYANCMTQDYYIIQESINGEISFNSQSYFKVVNIPIKYLRWV